jgi:response regulator of citrate/malate metabolism
MKAETLIVDDDEMVVFLHKIAIVESGLSTSPVVAYNGRQALDFINRPENREKLFLVLLDINMPDVDGWDFLDAIQSLDALIYVVMVTSSVDSRDKKKAQSYKQVIEYLEKPLSVNSCIHVKNLVSHLPE